MQKILIIVLSLCIAANAKASIVIPELGVNLRGKVASAVRTDSVVDEPGSHIDDYFSADKFKEIGYTTSEVDEKGNQTVCIYYNTNGERIKEVHSSYDAANNRVAVFVLDNLNNNYQTREYKYNDKGYPTEIVISYGSSKIVSTIDLSTRFWNYKQMFCFNAYKRPVKAIIYNDDNTVQCTIGADRLSEAQYKTPASKTDTTIYKDGSMLVVTKEEDGSGISEWYDMHNTIFVWYNTKGDTVEKRSVLYNINNDILQDVTMYYYTKPDGTKKEYLYTKDNKAVGTRRYDWNNNNWELINEDVYNDNKNESKHVVYANGEKKITSISRFDAYGNVLQCIEYDKNGSIKNETFYRYEDYDAHGNWHKRVSWSWDGFDMTMDMPVFTYLDITYHQ